MRQNVERRTLNVSEQSERSVGMACQQTRLEYCRNSVLRMSNCVHLQGVLCAPPGCASALGRFRYRASEMEALTFCNYLNSKKINLNVKYVSSTDYGWLRPTSSVMRRTSPFARPTSPVSEPRWQ